MPIRLLTSVFLVTAALVASRVLLASTPLAEAHAANGLGNKHTLFLIGDSTVKNGSGKGDRGQWGWGQVLQSRFDAGLVTVENRALGGRSSRTYLTEGLWQKTLHRIKPGDYVLIQFGHNDGGMMFEGDRPRASLKGNGEETKEGVVEATGQQEVVHSYGWYLRRYVADAKKKGATPIVMSPVPRDIWKDGHVVRAARDYGGWAAAAAEQAGVSFVDLNQIVADRYEAVGRETVHRDYFTPADHTHTSRQGAEVNADCVASGIRDSQDCDLKQFLLKLPDRDATRIDFGVGPAIKGFKQVSGQAVYTDQAGFGFEPGERSGKIEHGLGDCVTSDKPFSFSVRVAEGNHRVRVTLGGGADRSRTSVECELRRRMLDEIVTEPGEYVVREFVVNTRTPALPNGRRVKLKPRERTSEAKAWDSRLTFRFVGERPSVAKLEVLPEPDAPTVFLLGDSTVTDQPTAPWASWGQKLPRYFGAGVAVANHSESGETIAAAWSAGRCDKVLDCLRPGDWLMIQFGHNDMKSKVPNALERYKHDLARLVRQCRDADATPVLVTSMERITGIERDTLGDYPQAVRDLADQQGVALIDLHAMSKQLYRNLGERLPAAFQDTTHHTDYGAELLAARVVEDIRESLPELAAHLADVAPVRP